MFASQNIEPSIIDSLNSNLLDWYDAVDAGLKKSDIIPGTYEYSQHPSYGNVGELQEGADTRLDIQLNRFCVANLDDSNITLQQNIPITVKSTTAMKDNKLKGLFYVGYEYAAEVFYAYDIYSNSDRIQNITHANYEWFLLRNSVQPEAKIGSDAYATLEKIRRRDPNVPGAYVDLSLLEANKTVDVMLRIKVPLNSFLLFRQLRYVLSSFGTLTLAVTPSYKNIVVAPAFDPTTVDGMLDNVELDDAGMAKFRAYYAAHSRELDFGFHNLNQPCNWVITYDGTNIGHKAVTFECNNQTTDKVEIHLAYYMLNADVYNSSTARYVQVPLVFPVQKITSRDFATNLASGENAIDTALTVQLKHADGMAVVFKKGVHSHSCFENPQIRYQFDIDGKTYPRHAYNSVDDLRSMNLTLDFLNFNNLNTTSIDRDLANSLQPYWLKQNFDADGNSTPSGVMYHSRDRSNFMIGIPFADSCDFQGGVSTRGTIQIQLKGERLTTGDNDEVVYTQPVALFTEDAILKIRTVKPPGTPQISITEASLEQVIAAAGAV